MPWFSKEGKLSREDVLELTRQAATESLKRICGKPEKVLLLPPDITRAHSGSGWITEEFYRIFSKDADVHVIPTLGQHVPHTPEQNKWMFGSIPEEKIHAHDWREGSKVIGEVPAEFVKNRKRFCFYHRILLALIVVQVGLQKNSTKFFLKMPMYM